MSDAQSSTTEMSFPGLSTYVYYLGMLAMELRSRGGGEPHAEIGDLVVEVSHLVRTGKYRAGMECAFGTLERVDEGVGEDPYTSYTIRSLGGKLTVWENAHIVVVAKGFSRGGEER
jgi:hypothetical protein